ncbi:MAG: hypothetical protein U9P90_02120 [Patescibacteria group bacterium]|nr:hypothetical protein [Patescibacteria group bacterium]
MENYYIGIDPGVTGAIAVLSDDQAMQVFDFQRDNPRRLLQIYKGLNTPNTIACIENIITIPGAGREKLYESFYQHKFCLDYFGIQHKTVYPLTWKKEFNLSKKNKTKEDSYNLALSLFDNSSKFLRAKTKDHNRAEALLIAKYCQIVT